MGDWRWECDITMREGLSISLLPPAVSLPRTRWGVRRNVCAPGSAVVETLEDTPFYARSLIAAEILGAPVTMLHESVALDRFASPAVQAMLPFRMPRSWKS